MNEKEGNCVSLAKSYFIDMLFGKKKDVGSGIQIEWHWHSRFDRIMILSYSHAI